MTGWLGEAVKDYRVLLLEQWGTGRSAPVTERTPSLFTDARLSPTTWPVFRADSIVADAEMLRRRLTGARPWTTLGQRSVASAPSRTCRWRPRGSSAR